MPKVIEMYSIIYITCISFVIGINATNKSDYKIGEQNVIEEKELIMRDEQIVDKNIASKDVTSPVKGKIYFILYLSINQNYMFG